MKMNKLVRFCMMVAAVAAVFGVVPASSYCQDTSSTSGTIDATNPPSPNYYNAAKGYGIAGVIALDYPGGTSSGNLALGYQLVANAMGSTANTAIGYTALQSNTTGNYNTAIGEGRWNTTRRGTITRP